MAREGYYIHPNGRSIVAPDEDCPELDKVLGNNAAKQVTKFHEQAKAQDDEVDATNGAKELADKEGVDLTEVEGSGENGRITKADVEKHLED